MWTTRSCHPLLVFISGTLSFPREEYITSPTSIYGLYYRVFHKGSSFKCHIGLSDPRNTCFMPIFTYHCCLFCLGCVSEINWFGLIWSPRQYGGHWSILFAVLITQGWSTVIRRKTVTCYSAEPIAS